MSNQGRFTKDKFGHNMPADAPLYSEPPIYYTNAERLAINYVTDRDAALDLLPEGLELPDIAMATLLFLRYPFSTLGPYEEAILGLPCLFKGQLRFYIPHIVVNSDIPQAAGREIWGFPKKMAKITLEKEMDLVSGSMERPTGNEICSAGIRLDKPVEIQEPESESFSVSLRIIPSPEKGAKPTVAEIVETHSTSTLLESYSGPGWIKFETQSQVDPWHKLEVKDILDASYSIYNMVLGHGKVVIKY